MAREVNLGSFGPGCAGDRHRGRQGGHEEIGSHFPCSKSYAVMCVVESWLMIAVARNRRDPGCLE